MKELEFENYLLEDKGIESKIKAVRSRMSKARMIEQHFNLSLDFIVEDDNRMYEILSKIKIEMKDAHGNLSNALRKYYLFTHGTTFPTLSKYIKIRQGG